MALNAPRSRTIVLTDAGTSAFSAAMVEYDGTIGGGTPIPAPVFTTPSSIAADGTPQVGEPLTGIDGVATDTTSYTRRWLLGSTVLTSSAAYTPSAVGTYRYETIATGPGGETVSGSNITVAAATVPAPTLSQPSISPASGPVGTTFTATDGTVTNGTITGRRWLLGTTAIGTGTTVTPNAAGSLTRENTATGTNGAVITSTSPAVTVSAATVTPTLALAPTNPSLASNAAAGTLVSNITNVPAGVTPSVTPNDGRLVIAGDASAGWKVVVGMSAISAGTINFSVAATGATGASGVLTVSAASTGTPDGTPEAVISPAVTYQRSTYDATKVGMVADRPAWMLSQSSTPSGGQGICWPGLYRNPSAKYPDRRWIQYTTDHTSYAGGIGYAICVGDPRVPANWREYSDVVANTDWLDDIPNKPATAPVFFGSGRDASSIDQMETARMVKIGSTWHMTYQLERGITAARNQATLKATSTDLINWTGPNTPLMQVSALDAPGDGHHGYAEPFVNPGTFYPDTYLMYSLIGGQGQPTWGFWGSNDLETWRFITAMSGITGRATPDPVATSTAARLALQSIHPQSFKKTRQGWSVLAEMLRPSAGGSTSPAVGTVYEVLLADDLLTVIGRPIPVMSLGAAGSLDAGSIERPYVDLYGDTVLISYAGANANNDKRGLLATSPIRNPQNTWFNELWPLKPAPTKTTTFDLRSASALPAGLVAVTAGTATPAITFDAGGMSVVIDGTMATKGEAFFYVDEPIVPGDTEYVDIWVEGWDSPLAGSYRLPYIGLVSEKTTSAGITDGLFVTVSTSDQLIYSQLRVAGAQPISTVKTDSHPGIGYGNNQQRSKSKKRVGIRVFMRDGRAFVLGEGGAEMNEMRNGANIMGAALDKTKIYYPVVGFAGVGTASGTERIQKISVVKHVAPALAGDATLGVSASAVSATDAATYTFADLSLGAEATNRKVAFFVSGSSAAALATIGLSVTPAGGTAITATQRAVRQYVGTTNVNNFVAMFTADLPTGATYTATVTNSATALRCGIRSHVMYGVGSLAPTFVDTTNSPVGGNASMEIVASKQKGGICVAGATLSFASTAYVSTAETVQVETTNLPVSLAWTTANIMTWRGIRNGPTNATVLEATNTNSGLMIVASFAKA